MKCSDDCGGISGEYRGLLYQVTNTAKVKGDNNAGGIVGDLVGISHLIHAVNSGKIIGLNESFGGLVGEVSAYGTLISSSESTGLVQHDDSKKKKIDKEVGGLVGKLGSGGNDPSFREYIRVSA